MTRHHCYPTCRACVRDIVQARQLARVQLLPIALATAGEHHTSEEDTRVPAA